MAINFMSSINTNETHAMHSKSDSVKITIANEANEIIEELFDSILQTYQKGLEESMKGSKLVFYSVGLLHYKRHKISLNCGRSYIDSPKWLKNKKETINSKNNNDKCFQYALTVALNIKIL